MALAVVEQLHIVIGRAAGVLLLLHRDPCDGGACETVVLEAEVQQLVGQGRSR